MSGFKVVDTSSGATEATLDQKGQTIYGVIAISPDGRSLYLNQLGAGTIRIRVFDVPSSTLLPATAIDDGGRTQNGFRTPGVFSPDGRWMYALDAGNPTTNCTSTDGPACIPNASPPYVLALDLVSRRAQKVLLPRDQVSADFEKYLLWSVAVAPDGGSVYAINPALGVIDELDARQLTLRRTAQITVSRTDSGALAALARSFFPIAEAKRYITGVALMSADGARIYAAATKGIAVVGATGSFSSAVWQPDGEFDAFALSADGARLYAVSNANGALTIVATRDGAKLGELKSPAPGQVTVTILHVEPSR
jgi:DNA-binding beta-propeller fold protein YncE